MDVDLRLLRSFLVVSEEEHVGRAARRLYVSQPALTKQLQRLQAMVGADLLERQGRNVRLTAAGRTLAGEARDLLRRADELVLHARRVDRAVAGRVRVGFVPPIPLEVSSRLQASTYDVDLVRVDWVSQAQHLREGRLDLCLVRLPIAGADLETATVATEARVAGFAESHRLAGASHVMLAELDEEPIVDFPTQRDYWAVNPRPSGREPMWGPVVRSVEEMLEIVASGAAMCLTGASVARFYPRPGVIFVPVADLAPSVIAVAGLAERGPPAAAVWDLLTTA